MILYSWPKSVLIKSIFISFGFALLTRSSERSDGREFNLSVVSSRLSLYICCEDTTDWGRFAAAYVSAEQGRFCLTG